VTVFADNEIAVPFTLKLPIFLLSSTYAQLFGYSRSLSTVATVRGEATVTVHSACDVALNRKEEFPPAPVHLFMSIQ
jgi:hypothetical protein